MTTLLLGSGKRKATNQHAPAFGSRNHVDSITSQYLISFSDFLAQAAQRSGVSNIGFSAHLADGHWGSQHYREGKVLPPHPRQPLFKIGSLSKTIAVAALLRATERTAINLHAPMRTWFPELVLSSGSPLACTSLADLTRHRSILAKIEGTSIRGEDGGYRKAVRPMSEGELFRSINSGSTGAPNDRRSFRYSDFGIALVGLATARAMRTDYPTLVVRRVLRPNGIEDVFPVADHHVPGGSQRLLAGGSYSPAATTNRHFLSKGVLDPALGAIATARGINDFMHKLVSGKMLSKLMTAQLTSFRGSSGGTAKHPDYGMGIVKFPVGPSCGGDFCIGHLCVFEGTCGFSAHHPRTGATVTIFFDSLVGLGDDQRKRAVRQFNPAGIVRHLFRDLANRENRPSEVLRASFWRKADPNH